MKRIPMEKQHQLNITVLHHLPGILNLMQVVNLMMYGFVISQPMFFVLAMNNLRKPMRLSPQKILKQLRDNVILYRQILNYAILILSVFLVLLLNSSVENTLFILGIPLILNIITRFFPIQKTNMPANRLTHHWL